LRGRGCRTSPDLGMSHAPRESWDVFPSTCHAKPFYHYRIIYSGVKEVGRHCVITMRRILVAAFAVLFILTAWPGVMVGEETNEFPVTEVGTRQYAFNNTISINDYVFNITEGEPTLPPELVAPPPENGTIGSYIIHLQGPVYQYMKDAIRDLGIVIVGGVPYNAYHVHMTPEQAQLAENLSYVDWVGLYHPAYKILPDLEGLEVAVILTGHEIPESVIQQVRSKFESIEWEGPTGNNSAFNTTDYKFYGVLPSSTAINEIAANPYVHCICYIPEPQLLNGETNENTYFLVLIAIISFVIIVVFLVIIQRRKKRGRM
jgi:hypothetical protein